MQQQSDIQAYIPHDRVAALAQGIILPEMTRGTGLFADISGFTPLTEALRREYGEKAGVELLLDTLNRVFEALISVVESHGGSVIGFSGDAITCWFDDAVLGGDRTAAHHAVTAAVNMQEAMQQFAAVSLPDDTHVPLRMTAALASGNARRLVVGSPDIQLIDVLAGETILRLGSGETLAENGEIVLDAACASLLVDWIQVAEWRESDDELFAVLDTVTEAAQALSPRTLPRLPDAVAEQWVLPVILEYARIKHSPFLTELRSIVALFLRFTGIDYDHDPDANQKLNTYFTACQQIVQQYKGNIIQLTIGDKGSFFYAVFGAPKAYENDVQRALSSALDILELEEGHNLIIQMGISRGWVRSGAYGARQRKTYGAVGDDVNLAARLMAKAQPGTILVNDNLLDQAQDFTLNELPPVMLKGKSQPVKVWALTGRKTREEAYTYKAFVGREAELETLLNWVLTLQRGEVYTVYGEAGIGKTRLARELMRQLEDHPIYRMTITADTLLQQTLKPFIMWLNDFFELRTYDSVEAKLAGVDRIMEGLIADAAADGADTQRELITTRPFLASILNLPTDEQLVESAGLKLLYDNVMIGVRAIIRTLARSLHLFLFIEDAHWLDRLSLNLVRDILRDGRERHLAVLLTSRPGDADAPINHGFDTETPQQYMDLSFLSRSGVQALAESLFMGAVSDSFVDLLLDKSKGNPFFIEQIVLSLQEHHALIQVEHVWTTSDNAITIPDNLQTLLVSRIDSLIPEEKVTVKTAAVLGHSFNTHLVEKMLTTIETPKYVKMIEQRAFWHPVQVPEYVFHHALLRDVAYDMQPEAQRRELHHQAAETIEAVYPDDDNQFEALLFHWGRAMNQIKYVHYARDVVRKLYRIGSHKEMLDICETCLQYDLNPSDSLYLTRFKVNALYILGNPSESIAVGEKAIAYARETGEKSEELNLTGILGGFYLQTGQPDKGRYYCKNALVMAREQGNNAQISDSLRNLGTLSAYLDGDTVTAQRMLEEALEIAPGPVHRILALSNLGWVYSVEKHYEEAIRINEQALEIAMKVNNRSNMANLLSNLAGIYYNIGQYDQAIAYSEKGVRLAQSVGNRLTMGQLLENRGAMALREGDYTSATDFYLQAIEVFKALNVPWEIVRSLSEQSICYMYMNNMPAAWDLLIEGAEFSRNHERKLLRLYALIVYAIYIGMNGEEFKSAALLAMLQKHEEIEFVSHLKDFIDTAYAAPKDKLSEADYQAAVEYGQQLDYETEVAAFYAALK